MVLIHPGLMAGNRNTYKLGVILHNFKYKISYGYTRAPRKEWNN